MNSKKSGPPSKKTQVIEWIFNNLKFDSSTNTLKDDVVTMDDITTAINATKVKLSTANPANFWKDLTRSGTPGLNKNWPSSVFKKGFTGADGIGQSDRAVFVFAPIVPGQQEPFLDNLPFNSNIKPIRLQSLSMPQAMKELGRAGENWHAQVSDRLSVVASYFALASPRNSGSRKLFEVNFLQTGIKMKIGETDAAFSLLADDGMWLVSAEIKGRSEYFNLSQISRSAFSLEQAAKKSSALAQIAGVIPLGIKVVGTSRLWVVEFAPVSKPNDVLQKVGEAVFELTPPVPGVK